MIVRSDITPEIIRQFFQYNPENGKFVWRARGAEHFVSEASQKRWNTMNGGKDAFLIRRHGYLLSHIFKIPFFAHRVAWAHVYGEWPEISLDHINGKRDDNRICNLRLATSTVNNRNQAKRSKNSSGFGGVSWHKEKQKWRAYSGENRTYTHLGYFTSKEAAIAARKDHNKENGYTKRHGF